MHHAERAADFDAAEWQAWDQLLASEPSVHLSAPAVRAALESPLRLVRAAMWKDVRGQVQGLAISEDSEAISQGIDDFLEGNALFRRAKAWLHRKGGLTFSVRVIGTPLASGAHACRFAEGVNGLACLDELMALPGVNGAKAPRTWIVKDQPVSQAWADGTQLAGQSSWRPGWVDLEFDPVMCVDLSPHNSWEGYTAGMRTKARTKVKRILKLSEPLSFEALDLRGIETHRDRLHELYKNVYGRAAFRLGCLQPEDMACLKREMGERFQVWIAKLDGDIIGFHCGMTDGREVEAFFVGFEGRHNKSHALYQRMLVEFIQWGLALGCTSVNLGRTALDIKASLGAEPQRLVLHERMANPIMHALSRWAAGASAPKQPALKRAWKQESVHHEVVASAPAAVAVS
mgnify:CR=1 FL=1